MRPIPRWIGPTTPRSSNSGPKTSPAVAEELALDAGTDGVVVGEVEEGSTAARIGFQKGDIIQDLNGERMDTSREVEAALKERRRAWEVTISRGGQSVTSVFPG